MKRRVIYIVSDYRMSPYSCISTDNRVGLIEVVLNAETIANIQKEKGISSAMNAMFKKGCLLGEFVGSRFSVVRNGTIETRY